MQMTENVLYQHQTLGDLMAGVFEGTLTFEELLKHGDMGIGTFDNFEGELILLDGVAYQAREDGAILPVSPEQTTPHAAVTFFNPDREYQINQPMTLKKVRSDIVKRVRSKNVFSVVKITGHFEYIHTRAVPKQQKPYPRLIEATRVQPEFEKYDLDGTAIGIFTPELFDGVAKGGFHCHFISDDRTFGGHILDYIVDGAKCEIQTIESIVQHFAVHDDEFLDKDIHYHNLAAEMEEAEG